MCTSSHIVDSVSQDLKKSVHDTCGDWAHKLLYRQTWEMGSTFMLERVLVCQTKTLSNTRNTPLPTSINLNSNMSPKADSEKKQMNDIPYQSILESVMWGQLVTYPDLSFSVSLLVQFQANPSIDHWKALMHVIGYIKNTIDYGLTYSCNADLSPHTFVDADSQSKSSHVLLICFK